MKDTPIQSEKLLRKPDVLQRLGISAGTFYSLIRRGVIKAGVPVGPRIKAWPESEIQSFIDSCISGRDDGNGQPAQEAPVPTKPGPRTPKWPGPNFKCLFDTEVTKFEHFSSGSGKAGRLGGK